MTSLDSGIELNSLSGTKPEDSKTSPEREPEQQPEAWEHSILDLAATSTETQHH
jgi:hypothetical protein